MRNRRAILTQTNKIICTACRCVLKYTFIYYYLSETSLFFHYTFHLIYSQFCRHINYKINLFLFKQILRTHFNELKKKTICIVIVTSHYLRVSYGYVSHTRLLFYFTFYFYFYWTARSFRMYDHRE